MHLKAFAAALDPEFAAMHFPIAAARLAPIVVGRVDPFAVFVDHGRQLEQQGVTGQRGQVHLVAGQRIGLLAVAVLLLVPCAHAEPPSPGVTHVSVPPGTPLVEWGAQLFGGNCVTCHGPEGRGVFSPVQGAGGTTGLGPSLQGVGAQAADFYLRTGYMPLADRRKQPRRSRVLFSQRELEALTSYVASLGQGPAVPTPHPERGNLAAGLKQFTEHCAGCHQVAAAGGYVTNAVASLSSVSNL